MALYIFLQIRTEIFGNKYRSCTSSTITAHNSEHMQHNNLGKSEKNVLKYEPLPKIVLDLKAKKEMTRLGLAYGNNSCYDLFNLTVGSKLIVCM